MEHPKTPMLFKIVLLPIGSMGLVHLSLHLIDFPGINRGKHRKKNIYLEPNVRPLFLKGPNPRKQGRNSNQNSQAMWVLYIYIYLGGGFKYFLFSSLLGEDSHFD